MFEFHLGATLAYIFEDDSSLGVTFTHISNARINESNPGSIHCCLAIACLWNDCSESSGWAVSTRRTGGLQSLKGMGLEPIACASSSFQKRRARRSFQLHSATAKYASPQKRLGGYGLLSNLSAHLLAESAALPCRPAVQRNLSGGD